MSQRFGFTMPGYMARRLRELSDASNVSEAAIVRTALNYGLEDAEFIARIEHFGASAEGARPPRRDRRKQAPTDRGNV